MRKLAFCSALFFVFISYPFVSHSRTVFDLDTHLQAPARFVRLIKRITDADRVLAPFMLLSSARVIRLPSYAHQDHVALNNSILEQLARIDITQNNHFKATLFWELNERNRAQAIVHFEEMHPGLKKWADEYSFPIKEIAAGIEDVGLEGVASILNLADDKVAKTMARSLILLKLTGPTGTLKSKITRYQSQVARPKPDSEAIIEEIHRYRGTTIAAKVESILKTLSREDYVFISELLAYKLDPNGLGKNEAFQRFPGLDDIDVIHELDVNDPKRIVEYIGLVDRIFEGTTIRSLRLRLNSKVNQWSIFDIQDGSVRLIKEAPFILRPQHYERLNKIVPEIIIELENELLKFQDLELSSFPISKEVLLKQGSDALRNAKSIDSLLPDLKEIVRDPGIQE